MTRCIVPDKRECIDLLHLAHFPFHVGHFQSFSHTYTTKGTRKHNVILFFQFAVLIEVLKPLVLFLILMGIRFRREPDFVPEGKLPVEIHWSVFNSTYSLFSVTMTVQTSSFQIRGIGSERLRERFVDGMKSTKALKFSLGKRNITIIMNNIITAHA